jgi:hypothetical protein
MNQFKINRVPSMRGKKTIDPDVYLFTVSHLGVPIIKFKISPNIRGEKYFRVADKISDDTVVNDDLVNFIKGVLRDEGVTRIITTGPTGSSRLANKLIKNIPAQNGFHYFNNTLSMQSNPLPPPPLTNSKNASYLPPPPLTNSRNASYLPTPQYKKRKTASNKGANSNKNRKLQKTRNNGLPPKTNNQLAANLFTGNRNSNGTGNEFTFYGLEENHGPTNGNNYLLTNGPNTKRSKR